MTTSNTQVVNSISFPAEVELRIKFRAHNQSDLDYLTDTGDETMLKADLQDFAESIGLEFVRVEKC